MRLLHVAAEMNPRFGGVSKAIQTIVKGLIASGVHNELVCLDNPEASYLNSYSFPVHALGPAKTAWCFSPNLLPWLVKNYSRFDIIIIHGLWLYHGYATYKVMRMFNSGDVNSIDGSISRKVYIMPHGMLDPYFQKAAGRKLKALRNWIYWKIIEAKLINQVDGLLFTSSQEMALAGNAFTPYLPKRAIRVGLGVEDPPIYTAAMRDAFLGLCPKIKDDPYLLFIGRIDEKKGIDLLLEAYLSLIENRPGLPKLVVVGPGLDSNYGKKMLGIVSEKKTVG